MNLLCDLCTNYSPEKTKDIIKKELCDYFSNVYSDYFENIIGTNEGEALVVLSAHYDRIGFVVSHIEKGGFVRLSPLGGVDMRVIPSSVINIITDTKESFPAVICSTPPHLLKNSENNNVSEKIYADTGLSSDELKSKIKLGDIAFPIADYKKLQQSKVTAVGLDNAVGVTVIFETLRLLKKRNIKKPIKVIFTVQEELGEQGAKISAYNEIEKCSNVLVTDVTFGVDAITPGDSAFVLGGGACIGVSPILNRELTSLFFDSAKKLSMPYQTEVMPGKTGTDADMFALSRGGNKAALLSVPVRNMHTSAEICDTTDIAIAAEIFAEVISIL